MRIAWTGVSGFIGSYIARHLVEAGHQVTGLLRSTSVREHVDPFVDRFVVGEQDNESAWPDLLEDADAVVHNSYDFGSGDVDHHLKSDLLGSIRLLHASAPRRFVYMSTIAVHHDMRPRRQGQIDEDHPLRPSSTYGAIKASVEAHLWAAHYGEGRAVCALRPCGVFGINHRLDRSTGFSILTSLREGRPFQQQGGGKFVHVDDVAAATVAAIERDEANGRAFNLVDCYARWADWAKIAVEVLGVDADIDFSSPEAPQNHFDVAAARSLGVGLNRGAAGIRKHLKELAGKMGMIVGR